MTASGGKRRSWPAVALLGSVVVAAALVAGPPERDRPLLDSARPGGALALRRFLEEAGLAVGEAATPPPPPATFVLLRDLRPPAGARSLLEWVEVGGRLVVADPGSAVAAALGVEAEPVAGLLGGQVALPAGCVAAEAAGVGRITVASSEAALSGGEPAAVSCFRAATGAYLTVAERGRGRVVLLGGPSSLVNRNLRRDGNAALALRVMGPGPVAFGPPLPPGAAPEPTGLWEALPTPARVAVVQALLAVVLLALVRGRRFGRPVSEEPVSPIPASELVRASAGLYRTARAAGHAGHLMREAAARRLSRRLGLPPAAREDIPRALAAWSGTPEEEVRRVLGGEEPRSDEALIALGREIGALEEAVRR